ncbi:uncharacterized protein [Asterias amurensis]|uniref:uncharacterized protein isoform X1 n=1 Tax=Asterias amurensis TaxID=7602 RepID=UPI003AB2C649
MHRCQFLSKLMQRGHPLSLCRYFFQDVAAARPRSLSAPKNRSKLMRSNLGVKMSSIRTKSKMVAENSEVLEQNSPGKEDGNNEENKNNGGSSSSMSSRNSSSSNRSSRNRSARNSSSRNSSSVSMPLTSVVDDAAVSLDKLTTEERSIYRLHKEACKAGEDAYTDPSTGYVVLTQPYHIARGKCCGSCCRHCPYSHENVLERYRTKKFNTAFYV